MYEYDHKALETNSAEKH